jgi:hypothetical protein
MGIKPIEFPVRAAITNCRKAEGRKLLTTAAALPAAVG